MKRLVEQLDGVLVRQAAVLADDVRAGFRASLNIDEVIRLWNQTHSQSTAVAPADARAWARTNLRPDSTKLGQALKRVYAVGGLLGHESSLQAYAKVKLSKAIDPKDIADAININWQNWSPGNRASAFIANPKGGFSRLLNRWGTTLDGLNDTTVSRVGTALSAGLSLGLTDEEIAAKLVDVIGSSERALTVATTEMNAAMSIASMDNYQELGVERVEWLGLDACEICQPNIDQGPIPLGSEFESGDTEPPGHANCRCSILPVVEADQVASDLIAPVDEAPAVEADLTEPAVDVLPSIEAVERIGRNIESTGQATEQLWSPLVERQTGMNLEKDGRNEISVELKKVTATNLANDLQQQGFSPEAILNASHQRRTEANHFADNTGKVGLKNIQVVSTPANGEVTAITTYAAEEYVATIANFAQLYSGWEDNITAEEVQKAFDAKIADLKRTGRYDYRSFDLWVTGTPEANQAIAEAASSNIIQTWAETSNDSNSLSLAIQETAKSEFGLVNTADWSIAEHLTDRVAEKIAEQSDVYRAVLRSQYNATQQFFKEQGIKEVTLYRGVRDYAPNRGDTVTEKGVQVQLRPLSSFATDPKIAKNFATLENSSAVFRLVVPVEKILSMPGTGFGCFNETETVLLGGIQQLDVANAKDFAQFYDSLTTEEVKTNDFSSIWSK